MDLSRSVKQARRSLETALGGVTTGGRQAARHTRQFAHGIVSARWMQRLAIGTTLLAVTATLLYIPAAIGYLVLYYRFLPELETTVPVHLQYGFGPNPFGIASLNNIINHQPYDMTVTLTLPRSPANLDRGNFMVALHLLSHGPTTSTSSANQQPLPYLLPPARTPSNNNPRSSSPTDSSDLLKTQTLLLQPTRLDLPSFLASHTVLYTTTRPAIIPYVDPLAALASRVLFLPWHMLSPRAATTTVRLAVPMAEEVALGYSQSNSGRSGGSGTPQKLLLEVQAGQDIQVYDARVTIVARLRGLRGVMYRWRVTAFVLFTGAFWVGEMVMLGMALVAVLGWDIGGLLSFGGESDVKDEGDERDRDGKGLGSGEDWSKEKMIVKQRASTPLSSAPPTPEYAKPPKLVEVKKEEEAEWERELTGVPAFEAGQSTEADDEAESEGNGEGKGKGKAVVREAGSGTGDAGAGTSYGGQEGEGPRRRNISGQETSQ